MAVDGCYTSGSLLLLTGNTDSSDTPLLSPLVHREAAVDVQKAWELVGGKLTLANRTMQLESMIDKVPCLPYAAVHPNSTPYLNAPPPQYRPVTPSSDHPPPHYPTRYPQLDHWALQRTILREYERAQQGRKSHLFYRTPQIS